MGYGSPIDLIREGREKLAIEDRSGWSATALSDHMLALTEEVDRMGAELRVQCRVATLVEEVQVQVAEEAELRRRAGRDGGRRAGRQ